MTDATSSSSARKPKKSEVIEDAVVVEETAVEPAPKPAESSEPRVVEAVVEPEPVRPAQPQVVYVQAPAAPVKKGNRGVGALIALLSALVFTALLAIITAIIGGVATGRFSFGFLAQANFYLPTLFFVIGFVLLVLLANRANWWAYIVGSVVVGLVVYFGTVGAVLLGSGVILRTPDEAAAMFANGLANPIVIAAALLAREVSLWTGSIIARRGRRVKVRNTEAREAWERELAEKKAEHERATAAASSAV
ncbi:hypothetical protein [Antiquaquibacter soli]|uniref:ABC transporter permease n=1 Tax=Antiquaquibacter soli TaxID=3064523 RepID=A0ABT9BPA3_9MICO|nr:hypothetical protein [Protaetiibacter sp. WY-16]MDO7882855.1 hypothetical protein [Protaetiibacter sp. WY-16]